MYGFIAEIQTGSREVSELALAVDEDNTLDTGPQFHQSHAIPELPSETTRLDFDTFR